MKKKINPLFLAVGVLVVLGVAYVGVVKGKELQQKEEEENKQYLVEMEHVVSLSYEHGGNEFSFDKEGDTWTYAEDPEFPLNESKISTIESDVLALEPVRVLEGAEELSEYGLTEPTSWIQLTDDTGVSKKILIGNQTDSNYYASIEGETSVYTIASGITDDLAEDLYDLIVLESFPYLSSDDIVSVEVEKPDGTGYVLEKQEKEIPNEIVESLSSIYVSSCENYKAGEDELALYGLDKPTVVTYRYVDESSENAEDNSVQEETIQEETIQEETIQEMTFEVGSLDESGTYYFVRLSDSSAVNKIAVTALDTLVTKTMADFQ